MATFTEKLRILIEADPSTGISGFKKLSSEIKTSEGVVGKFKAGVKGLSQAMADNPQAVEAAAFGAGAAILKLADSASKTGVEVGKLRDATGLSAKAASQWVETANDMGIGSDKVAGLIEKMTKNLGQSPDAFAKLGVNVKHATDGTVDMSATLLNAIDVLHNIDDPTKRAAAGAKLFGKSWSDASELIAAGADKVKDRLNSVHGSAIFTDAQIKQAREFRDMEANLKDVGEHLALSIGKGVVPALTTMGKQLDIIGKAVDALDLQKLIQVMAEIASPTLAAADAYDHLKEHMGKALETKPLEEWIGFVRNHDDVLKDSQYQAELWVAAHKDAGISVTDLVGFLNSGMTSIGKYRDSLLDATDAAHGLEDGIRKVSKAQADAMLSDGSFNLGNLEKTLTTRAGGHGAGGSVPSIVNINVQQKITAAELVALAQEAQRRFGVGVLR